MAKVISQETFDDVVKENILEFSMSPEEAKKESIEQFEAQGINLANIIKDLSINETTGKPVINETVEKLEKHVSETEKLDTVSLIKTLDILDDECRKSLPHRVLAGKLEGQKIIVAILKKEIAKSEPDHEILLKSIATANSLSNKQPDIFDDDALQITVDILKTQNNEAIICGTLQWMSKICILHEMNRQNIINTNITDCLGRFITEKNPNIIKEICPLLRYLVLDDDIRVQFGKAHEHAKVLASEFIIDLTKMLSEFNDINILCELLLTIASLSVRQEFCVAIEDAGGLKNVLNLLLKYPDSERIGRESLKLLRALAGHDAVKAHIIQQGAAPIIQNVINMHKETESLARIGLLCISTLTLRVKENSTAFFETGIPETIAETMRLHPDSKFVQRNGAWAIRNMVARAREQCDTFLSFGIEDILHCAMQKHPSIHQDLKAALRDLGCKVELKEEWTGTAAIKITY